MDTCQLIKIKHNKPWMTQLAMGTKRKLPELIKECPLNMNGMNTSINLKILHLESYDALIGMGWFLEAPCGT